MTLSVWKQEVLLVLRQGRHLVIPALGALHSGHVVGIS